MLDPNGPLCKAECVVGETTVVTPIEGTEELERPALKVRDVRIALEDITAEVTDEQVLFQGTLVQQVFFIATNNQEFHQEIRRPFTGVALIPGAQPGFNVTIRPTLLRVDKILTNGNQIRVRAILSVFVKVTATCEINVAEDTAGPLVICRRVVAQGCKQVLTESLATLDVPAQKVHEIQGRVQNLTCEVIANKVIIQGEIHKQIFFVGPDDVVHHQAEDIPFTTFIDVPGAQPGQSCQASGSVEHISWHLCDPVTGTTTTALADPYVEEFECPTFARLLQKTVIDVCVHVAEDRQVHIATVPVQAVTCTTVCQ